MWSLFIPSIPNERPVLLILDGQSSHVSYEHNIHLLMLPAHTTHCLQPLDIGVINHIKRVWQGIVGEFTRRERRVISK